MVIPRATALPVEGLNGRTMRFNSALVGEVTLVGKDAVSTTARQ